MKLIGNDSVLIGVQVGVYVPGCLDRFVTEPPGYFHYIYTHIYQHGNVRMANSWNSIFDFY